MIQRQKTMIIDAHTHIFPETVRLNRSACFESEPEFKLLYNSPKAAMASIDELLAAMDAHGVDLSVVCGFPWRTPDLIRRNNDTVIDAVLRHPGRIKGLACFDAAWEGAADETRRCLAAGLSGAGELAFYLSGIDETALKRLEPVMAVLREFGNLPCNIHTNEPIGHAYPGKTPITLEQIYALAGAFPDNRIILAHWGGGILFYRILKKQAKEVLKNIWYDTAASPFLFDPAVYEVAALAGAMDKVLFGTDFPLLTADRYYRDLEAVSMTDEQKRMVLGGNARELFGL